MVRLARYAWVLPNSVAGVLLTAAALCTGGRASIVDGVMESHGGAAAFVLRRLVPLRGGASAMTLGHVVLGRDARALERTRSHERVHVRQYERWGPFFLPAYVGASLIAAVRGGNYYRDNSFERGARSGAE